MARLKLLKPRLSTTAPTVRNVTTSTERTRGRAWMEIRKRVLRANPLCVHCTKAGRLAPATEVDHIKPLAQGGTDDGDNLQGLCEPCHKAKSAHEQGSR
jgi:5-methylcytosine-specific restriction protein A